MLCQDDRSFNGCNVLLSISLFISTKYDGLIQRTEKWTEFTFSQRAAAPTFKGSEWGLDVTKMFLMEFLRLLTGMLLTLRVCISCVTSWHTKLMQDLNKSRSCPLGPDMTSSQLCTFLYWPFIKKLIDTDKPCPKHASVPLQVRGISECTCCSGLRY
jgi:hypothetical protein